MIPPIAIVVPIFLIVQQLGLLNKHLGLILARTAFNLPFRPDLDLDTGGRDAAGRQGLSIRRLLIDHCAHYGT
jgi:hypothetical protein